MGNKITPQMDNNLKNAVEVLIDALRTDEGYRIGWQANIAMSFYDEWRNGAQERDYIDLGKLDIHEISNNAAKNFLELLCK